MRCLNIELENQNESRDAKTIAREIAENDTKKTEILIIYQKEPHAGQMAFKNIRQPESLEERIELAARMKDEYEMPMPVLVDTMKDQSRAYYSELPSPVFIINEQGLIQKKFPWPDVDQIRDALLN